MKGDFTRGHRPDTKRGEKYRRVLLQEGRLVLDSDVAAGADAIDTSLRDLASDVGCEKGSPDLGYLVTPGPLLALFETLDGVTLPAPGGAFEAYRDYAVKYHERFPSIYVGAQAAAGSVTVVGRRALDASEYKTVRIWARAAVQVDLTIEGQPASFLGADATKIQPYDVAVPGGVTSYQTISFGFNASAPGNEAWIAMIEGLEEAQLRPLFWHTDGRYYLRGLAVESAEDGQYPDATFPVAKGFTPQNQITAAGQYFVAYLEGWERLVTRIEDPGIQEQALGGVLDTTVRSKAIGQVKIATFFADGVDPEAKSGDVLLAFDAIDAGAAELEVTTTPTVDNLDPCAIPEAGGYIGADNRFYRFEVHEGGAIGDVVVKWSRNNGSDAFAVASIDPGAKFLTLAAGAEVRDGDLIELLDETDDLGDQAAAVVALATPSLRPSIRSVGQLFYAETTATPGQIKLRNTDPAKTPANVPADFGPTVKVPKVRVWHGLLDTAPPTLGDPAVTEFKLGDGVTVKLSGSDFRPGDYWQWEARKLKDNANGAWQKSPHGPERIFAPLALFRHAGASNPVELIRWYDHQYSAICELNADDIAYDGGKVGTDADTVQEAIDELYEKTGGGCCDIVLEPRPTGDDTARLQKAIDDLPDGGEICLKRGVYRLGSTLVISSKRVTIAGCPHATLVGTGANGAPMFALGGGGELLAPARLELRELLAVSRGFAGPIVDIVGPFFGGGEIDFIGRGSIYELRLEGAALVHAGAEGVAVRVGEPGLPALHPRDIQRMDGYGGSSGATLEAVDSIIAGRWGVTAISAKCRFTETAVLFERVGVFGLTITSLELHRCTFYGAFDQTVRADLALVDDADLEPWVSQLLDQSFWSTIEDSVAVAAPYMWGGHVEENTFAADCALYFNQCDYLRSRANQYSVMNGPGVRLDAAYSTSFERDDFYASVACIHVPYTAYDLSIRNAKLSGASGAVFCAQANGSALPASTVGDAFFYSVRMQECVLDCFEIGILWGPYFTDKEIDPEYVLMQWVDLSDNVFPSSWYGNIGIACSLNAPPLNEDYQSPGNPRLRIARNQIYAGLGVAAFGDDVLIEENVIHTAANLNRPWVFGLSTDGVGAIGILLFDGGRVVVRGNVVELPHDPSTPMIDQTVGLLLWEKYTEGARDDLSISDNVLTAMIPFFVTQGEQGAGVHQMTFRGNRALGVISMVASTFDCVYRDNSLSGWFAMAGGGRNVVSGNQFSYFGGFAGLLVSAAQEEWQIEGNRSERSITIQPTVQATPGAGDVELQYHPQVIGNWAAVDLVVGHPPQTVNTGYGTYSGALVNAESRAQIVANRAGNWLLSGAYSKIVFAHNFARFYSPLWSQTAVIVSPNYDAP